MAGSSFMATSFPAMVCTPWKTVPVWVWKTRTEVSLKGNREGCGIGREIRTTTTHCDLLLEPVLSSECKVHIECIQRVVEYGVAGVYE